MRRLQGFAPQAAFSGYKEKTVAKRVEKRERRSAVLEPDAAGIDIGAHEIYVVVPLDRDEETTRRSAVSPTTYTHWPIGWRAAEFAPSRWNRPAFTGYRCFRY
jgi:hypothetical protein